MSKNQKNLQKLLKMMKNIFTSSERHDEFQRNFQENVTYDKIKSQKNQGFTLSLENTISEKPHGWRQIEPQSF